MDNDAALRPQPPLALDGPEGLGGWLVWVQAILYAAILSHVVQLLAFIPTVATGAIDHLISADSEFYHPLWRFILVFETGFAVCMLVFCVFILFHFYKKRVIVPRLMLLFFLLGLCFAVVDTVLLYQIPFIANERSRTLSLLGRQIITSAVWIVYFRRSRRVKNTFVR